MSPDHVVLDDLMATFIVAETLVIYWFLFAFACMYEGEHKWIAVPIAILICGKSSRTRNGRGG